MSPPLSQKAVVFPVDSRVNIANLDPQVATTDNFHIEATVALVWPYSNSHGTLSLLLAERDVQLRKVKGQVKVTFHGRCAKEVAKTQVGIGDLVLLGLSDVSWTETGENVSTPGKKVSYDLEYRTGVRLEVRRGTEIPIAVNVTARLPSLTSVTPVSFDPSTPRTTTIIDVTRTRFSTSYHQPHQNSPKRVSSGSFLDASLDPFAEDDGYIVGRGRKRTKYARRSGTWKLVEHTEEVDIESPGENDGHAASRSSAAVQTGRYSSNEHEEEDNGLASAANGLSSSFIVAGAAKIPAIMGQIPGAVVSTSVDILEDHTVSPVDRIEGSGLPLTESVPQLQLSTIDQIIFEPHGQEAKFSATLSPALPDELALASQLELELEQSLHSDGQPVAARGSSPLQGLDGMRDESVPEMPPLSGAVADEYMIDPNMVNEQTRAESIERVSPDVAMEETPVEEHNAGAMGAAKTSHLDTIQALQTASTPPEHVEVTANDASMMTYPNQGDVSFPGSAGPQLAAADETRLLYNVNEVEIDLDALQQQIDNQVEYDLFSAEPNKLIGDEGVDEGVVEDQMAEDKAVEDAVIADKVEHEVVKDTVIEDEVENEVVKDTTVEHETIEDEDMYGSSALSRPQEAALIEETSPSRRDVQDWLDGAPVDPNLLLPSADHTPQDLKSRSTTRSSPSLASTHPDFKLTRRQEEAIAALAKTARESSEPLSSPGFANNFQQTVTAQLVENQATDASADSESDEEPVASESLQVTTDGEHEGVLAEKTEDITEPFGTPVQAVDGEASELTITQGPKSQRSGSENDLALLAESTIQEKTPHKASSVSDVLVDVDDLGTEKVLTPPGTQEPNLPHTRSIQYLTENSNEYPPTPELTQGTQAIIAPTTSAPATALQSTEVEEVEPVVMEGVVETKPRRKSQRLIRKSFANDTIGNAYFTPHHDTHIEDNQAPRIQDSIEYDRASVPEDHNDDDDDQASMPQDYIGNNKASMSEEYSEGEQAPIPKDHNQEDRDSMAEFDQMLEDNDSSCVGSPTPDVPEITGVLPPSHDEALEDSSTEVNADRDPSPHEKLWGGWMTLHDYFPCLATLEEYHGQMVDVMAVCTSTPESIQKAKSGLKDYYTTLQLADISFTHENIIAQIFRPQKAALPTPSRGHVLLLHNMKVQSKDNKPMLLSTETSSWVDFDPNVSDFEECSVRGPPVEYGVVEVACRNQLFDWWYRNEENYPKPAVRRITRLRNRQNNVSDQAGPSSDTNLADSQGVDDPEAQDMLTPLLPSASSQRQTDLPSPTMSMTSTHNKAARRRSSRRSESLVHELRDGTKYVDDDNDNTLIHELRDGVTYVDD